MELFAFLGTQEIVIVLVLALIVFGPQKLPEIGRQVGAAMRELRKMTGDVQRALDFEDHGGSSYNAYDNTNWYDTTPSPVIAAPQGATVAQVSSAGMIESVEPSYSVASEGAYGDDFIAPPGPPVKENSRSFEHRDHSPDQLD